MTPPPPPSYPIPNLIHAEQGILTRCFYTFLTKIFGILGFCASTWQPIVLCFHYLVEPQIFRVPVGWERLGVSSLLPG